MQSITFTITTVVRGKDDHFAKLTPYQLDLLGDIIGRALKHRLIVGGLLPSWAEVERIDNSVHHTDTSRVPDGQRSGNPAETIDAVFARP